MRVELLQGPAPLPIVTHHNQGGWMPSCFPGKVSYVGENKGLISPLGVASHHVLGF